MPVIYTLWTRIPPLINIIHIRRKMSNLYCKINKKFSLQFVSSSSKTVTVEDVEFSLLSSTVVTVSIAKLIAQFNNDTKHTSIERNRISNQN